MRQALKLLKREGSTEAMDDGSRPHPTYFAPVGLRRFDPPGYARAADAAGEERQTGAVCRSQFPSGAREGGLLYRNGEKVPVQVNQGQAEDRLYRQRTGRKMQKVIQTLCFRTNHFFIE